MIQQAHAIWLKADVDGFDTLVDLALNRCEEDEAPLINGPTYLVQPRSIAFLMAHTIG